MKEVNFTLGDNNYLGVATGNTWNGFECPKFSRSVCTSILNDLKNEGSISDYSIESDCCKVYDNEGVMDQYWFDLDDLCGLGAFGWVWQLAE